MYLIAVMHRKLPHLLAHGFHIACFAEIQAEHRAVFVRHEPLHFNVPQSRGRQDSARQVQHIL